MIILIKTYDDGSLDTKRYVLKTYSSHSGWSIAGDFIKAIQNEDQKHRELAFSLLNGWYNYSMKLGVTQTDFDIQYVLFEYKRAKIVLEGMPRDIKKILEEIPFVFHK